MADGRPKEGVKTENNHHTNLKVAGQDGSVVQFKIKSLFNEKPIVNDRTPAQLEREDKDVIDVFQQHTGGVY
uniref:small ubiquitin-related modifier 2-like n=1 Tax=Callospermophilus lateralis TaxID=76772 RepID=UPI0040389B7A